MAAVLVAAGPACTVDPPPPAAASNLRLAEDEQDLRWTLDARGRGATRDALRSVAAGHAAVDPPERARHGSRWGDVELAVYHACNDVEMAIVRTHRHDNRFVFDLKTLDDRPGRLEVIRTGGAQVYAADAAVGWFENDEQKRRLLLEALDRQMRAFGRKRAFEDD